MNRTSRALRLTALRSLAALLLIGAASLDASAQPKSAEAKEAKALFDQGMGLSTENKWPEALEAFEKSNKMVPLPVVQYNIAFTLRAMGRFVEAKQRLQTIIDAIPTLKPPLKPALKEDIDHLYAEVKEKIARVSIEIDPVDAELQIDGNGTKLPPGGAIELDVGKHVFLLKKDGYETTSVTKTLPSGNSSLRVTAKEIPPPQVLTAPPPPPPPPRPFYTRPWFLTTAGLVVAAGAAVTVYIVTRPEDARQPALPPTSTIDRVIPTMFRF